MTRTNLAADRYAAGTRKWRRTRQPLKQLKLGVPI